MQVFPSSTNTISRVSIFGAVFFAVGLLFVVYLIFRSPYVTQVNVTVDQPVPFSHEHHITAVGSTVAIATRQSSPPRSPGFPRLRRA